MPAAGVRCRRSASATSRATCSEVSTTATSTPWSKTSRHTSTASSRLTTTRTCGSSTWTTPAFPTFPTTGRSTLGDCIFDSSSSCSCMSLLTNRASLSLSLSVYDFRGDAFDSTAFKNWILRGDCPAIPAVLRLYEKLMGRGFQVFLVTGRDEEVLGSSTAENLAAQGFVGHQRLIMRSPRYRGQGAVAFKSAIRRQLVAEGYRIRGNVGDQWSDLLGDCVGDRTFKIPNPMYFVQ
ncbi:hypothetical protein C4D60_Mb10t28180 [Musa balbisiana]|uniref:Acid phosphatase n=1 Tax=Musa balbisiana TaxID=52838 RepID=A0A4S8J0B0_MUSBA|nr:hypothetical protein C4D60_Mb10t28180 [Musa balbisiana]